MAIAEYHDTNTPEQVEGAEQAHNGAFRASLPDWEDIAALEAYLGELESHADVRGVPTMITRLKNYLMHDRLKEDAKKRLRSSVSFINHIPVPKQSKFAGMTIEEKQAYQLCKYARGFFNGLLDMPGGDKQLKRQCELFGLDFSQYETLEDAVEALVEAQLPVK